MNQVRAHTGTIAELLLCLGGPLLWAAQFYALYGAATLACLKRTEPHSASFFAFAVASTLLTLLAVAGLGAWQVARRGHLAQAGAEVDGARFLRAISIVLGAAAALAILWGTLPVLVLSSCSGAS